jgi:hypothetical protein
VARGRARGKVLAKGQVFPFSLTKYCVIILKDKEYFWNCPQKLNQQSSGWNGFEQIAPSQNLLEVLIELLLLKNVA